MGAQVVGECWVVKIGEGLMTTGVWASIRSLVYDGDFAEARAMLDSIESAVQSARLSVDWHQGRLVADQREAANR